jgi:hypothetical protein
MHTHQVAVNAWRLKHQKAPVTPLLEKVARDKVLILTTGGGDWLDSSGDAVPAEGGFRVSARKPFSSGAPAGNILSTSAVLRDKGEVIHFGIPMSTPGVSIKPTWRTMGMRNTASHDVVLENVLVPESAVAVRRPQGKWHPLFHLISMLSLPLVYAVYVGVAEAARERALNIVRKRRTDEHLLQAVGEMENQIESARIAHASWVAFCKDAQPGPATSSKSMIHRTLTTRGVLGDGRRRWRGVLPLERTRAAVPRRAGRALPPTAGRLAESTERAPRARHGKLERYWKYATGAALPLIWLRCMRRIALPSKASRRCMVL